MCNTNINIIRQIQEELVKAKRSKAYFEKKTNFTRDRDLPFEAVFYMILDLPRRSIGIEIEDVLETMNDIDGGIRSATPSAFSQARGKIKEALFEQLNDRLIKSYYAQEGKQELKKWKGFILQAVDGSLADMINTKEIIEEFGTHSNQHKVLIPQARVMCLYDVLNGITRKNHIGNLSEAEGTVAKRWVSELGEQTLTLYDRLYPSKVLLYLHHYHKKGYVMRCKRAFNNKVKAFTASRKKEKVEKWELSKSDVKKLKEYGVDAEVGTCFGVRLIRVKLKTGEDEILLTSLIDRKQYGHKLFKKLYAMRWGVETNYSFLKNTLQIEINSGRSVRSVYQDFYATILRANIQSLIQMDCEEQVKKKTKGRKWKYRINKNIAAGVMKRRIIKILFSTSEATFEKYYEHLKKLMVKHLCPIKPDRSSPRKKRSQKVNGKYRTMKNYKRAA